MIRDVIEIQFLIDVFRRNPQELSQWVSLPPKERERRFSPFELKKKLDREDGLKTNSGLAHTNEFL